MNEEQIKSAIRSLVSAFGGMLAGWGASKGWVTADQILGVLNSESFIGAVAAIAAGTWGLFTHKKSNAVAVVTAMARDPESPVKAVVVEPTPEGRELVRAVTPSEPGSKAGVVIAGTPAAATVAH
jgi:hypothetical protein